ncbi:MAG: hypothetical protein ACREIA_24885, partial [Opitutaceae bacterium]
MNALLIQIETSSQQAGDFAPETIAGRSAITAIKSGTGTEPPYGAGRMSFAIEGTFTHDPLSPNVFPYAGTYSYVKTGSNTATLTISDYLGLTTSTETFVFSSPFRAEIATSDEFGTATKIAVFESPPAPTHGSLVNMSVRAVVPASSNVIPGFVIEGAPQTVLIRAGGPA